MRDELAEYVGSGSGLAESVERRRRVLHLDTMRQERHEQFFTPASVARHMASLVEPRALITLRVLDPGAGMGMLSAALIEAALSWPRPPARIELVAYEIDEALRPHLEETLDLCQCACNRANIVLDHEIYADDYIACAADVLAGGLFERALELFDACVMNPPYGKIRSESAERGTLRRVGVETSNLYTAFLSLSARLLVPEGQLVSITPRSFANGSYFETFRRDFLGMMAPDLFHVFGRRDRAFKDDRVLQETIIMHATRRGERPPTVTISSSMGPDGETATHDIPYSRLVRPGDHEMVLHLIEDTAGDDIAARMDALPCTLDTLGLDVSTGPVVDFRATAYLRVAAGDGTVPLLWPEHCRHGRVTWPRTDSDKPQAIIPADGIQRQLVPTGTYVLIKRFSAKEERRRVVAVVLDGRALSDSTLGLENHLNYIHAGGAGLDSAFARGVALYLNSTLVDRQFRQFSGHTQVNATDVRRLRYPSLRVLETIGCMVGDVMPAQDVIDTIVDGAI